MLLFFRKCLHIPMAITYVEILILSFSFHPFYISDSAEGGFEQKRPEERQQQRIFAGVAYDNEGYPYPTAGKSLEF